MKYIIPAKISGPAKAAGQKKGIDSRNTTPNILRMFPAFTRKGAINLSPSRAHFWIRYLEQDRNVCDNSRADETHTQRVYE